MSEVTIAKMQKDIDHIKENVGEIKEYIKEDRAWKEEFSKCLDKKYAGKWIEFISVSAFGGIIVGVVMLLLSKI
jgi:hypothetical protein